MIDEGEFSRYYVFESEFHFVTSKLVTTLIVTAEQCSTRAGTVPTTGHGQGWSWEMPRKTLSLGYLNDGEYVSKRR